MKPFLAYIMPIDADAHPEHPIAPGGKPPGTWGGSGEGFPTHPGPLPPTGIWPGPGGPSQGPGFPTPPIVIPPDQPGIWPPPNPAHPAHPIVIPPPGHLPPGVDPPPGGETGSPEHPINLPPGAPGGSSPGFWALAYFPDLMEGKGGWVWVWVPVPAPDKDRPQVNPLKK